MTDLGEGWDKTLPARKWHYFRDGISLCGRWLRYFHPLDEGFAAPHPEDRCRVCGREWDEYPEAR